MGNMGWNHRVLVTDHKGTLNYSIHEVYYDEKGEPNAASMNPVNISSEDPEGLAWMLDRMKECLQKPALWGDDKFPQEFDDSYRAAYEALEKYNNEKDTEWSLDEMLKISDEEPILMEGLQVLPSEIGIDEKWQLLKEKVGEEVFNSWVEDLMPFGGGLSSELEHFKIPSKAFEIIHQGKSTIIRKR